MEMKYWARALIRARKGKKRPMKWHVAISNHEQSYTGTLRDPNAGCEPKFSGHCLVDEMLGNKKENWMCCELPLNHTGKIAMLIRTRFIH